ncbi:uncharacterized protein [Engystomops pustulosus]
MEKSYEHPESDDSFAIARKYLLLELTKKYGKQVNNSPECYNVNIDKENKPIETVPKDKGHILGPQPVASSEIFMSGNFISPMEICGHPVVANGEDVQPGSQAWPVEDSVTSLKEEHVKTGLEEAQKAKSVYECPSLSKTPASPERRSINEIVNMLNRKQMGLCLCGKLDHCSRIPCKAHEAITTQRIQRYKEQGNTTNSCKSTTKCQVQTKHASPIPRATSTTPSRNGPQTGNKTQSQNLDYSTIPCKQQDALPYRNKEQGKIPRSDKSNKGSQVQKERSSSTPQALSTAELRRRQQEEDRTRKRFCHCRNFDQSVMSCKATRLTKKHKNTPIWKSVASLSLLLVFILIFGFLVTIHLRK